MTADANKIDAVLDACARRFVLWSLKTLGFSVEQRNGGVYSVELPMEQREAIGGSERLEFSFEAPSTESGAGAETLTFRSPPFCWLIEQLQACRQPLHAVPAHQPASVHELSQRLFDPYTLDGGNVHLSGCTLEDRPLLRVTFLVQEGGVVREGGVREEGATHRDELTHVFLDAGGDLIEGALCDSLELDDLAPLSPPPVRLNDVDLERWIAAARKVYESCDRSGAGSELVAVTIIWCKYAAGKLTFVYRDTAAEVGFSGWARRVLDGHSKPPPFQCPLSGEESYHLAVTDDGRLTVAEAIGTCEETGQRVVKTELETCEATGRTAISERLVTCPVLGKRVLRSALATCGACQQVVSPRAIARGRCSACRGAEPVSKDDPRMARVLGEYLKLDRWRHWRIAETSKVYILTATGLAKRLLLVADKDSLEVLRLAKSGLFSSAWSDVTSAERRDLLE